MLRDFIVGEQCLVGLQNCFANKLLNRLLLEKCHIANFCSYSDDIVSLHSPFHYLVFDSFVSPLSLPVCKLLDTLIGHFLFFDRKVLFFELVVNSLCAIFVAVDGIHVVNEKF